MNPPVYVRRKVVGQVVSFERMGRYFGRDSSTLVRDVGYLEGELKSSATLRRQVATIAATLKAIK